MPMKLIEIKDAKPLLRQIYNQLSEIEWEYLTTAELSILRLLEKREIPKDISGKEEKILGYNF